MNTAEQVANETVPLSDPDLANAFARVINDLNQHDGPEGMDDDTAADYISALRENGFTVYKSGQSAGNDASEIAVDATHGLDPNLADQVTTRVEQAYVKFLERHANSPNLGRKP